jgi:drug/metabolite transporter (DMT)-like permease
MCVSGKAWGVTSLRGKGVSAPVAMTTEHFTRSAPMAIIASAIAFSAVHMEASGMLLTLISGIVTSGLLSVLWYRALRSLTTSQASVVQLVVPVLDAFGGVAFLCRPIPHWRSQHLLTSAAASLFSVLLFPVAESVDLKI